MKKIILFVGALIPSLFIHSQLIVDSIGNVSVTTSSTNNDFEVQITSNGLIADTNCRNLTSCAIGGNAVNIGQFGCSTGVRGVAQVDTLSGGVSRGVFGQASYGKKNNYAIYGQLCSNKGAAVYGTVSAFDFMGTSLNQAYAGYFAGDTYVRGYFTATSGINGTLLTNARTVDSTPDITTNPFSDRRVCRGLADLTIHTYFISQPERTGSIPDEMNPQIMEELLGSNESLKGMASTRHSEPVPYVEQQIYSKQHYGIDVNQLEQAFPDLVYEQEDGTKSINYVEMVPILVQAINELNAKIEMLENRGESANEKNAQSAEDKGDSEDKLLLLSLGQNKPNPFSNSTTIEVCIPEDVQKAFIYVYDLQGKKVEQVDIIAHGKQNIQLTSANLADGMYLYSLIADGKVIETRRMIVEK